MGDMPHVDRLKKRASKVIVFIYDHVALIAWLRNRLGWTDTKHRSLINFFVYCPRGMIFVKSVDVSEIVKSARNLFKLFDEVVTWVGPKNIVHMDTDNASNYVFAGKLLCEKYKTIS